MKTLNLLILLLFSSVCLSQRIIQPRLVELDLKGIIYKKEWSFDFKIHENGYAIAYNTGEIQSYYKTKYYQFEIGIMKDPREKRQSKLNSINQLINGKSFVFGKINSVINLRASLGFKRYLSEKAKKKGLAVGYSYAFGPSIALLKPYYLVLIYRSTENQNEMTEYREESFSEENADKFLNYNDIDGGSSYFKGFNQIKVRPGLQGKIAGHFALGAFDKYVKSVEVGVMADIYIKKIPILVETDEISNKPYFIKLYALAQFGIRKN